MNNINKCKNSNSDKITTAEIQKQCLQPEENSLNQIPI